jgi:LmbE family N-acetylglucosaminyl deacetylase
MDLDFLSFSWFEHLSSILISLVVLFYIYRRRSDIIRSTQNISRVFSLIIGVTVVILILNAVRMAHEISGAPENPFTSSVDLLATYGNLIGQTLIVLYLLSAKIVIEKDSGPGKVLVIGAHPDDIEIAAGASIAKLHDAGFEVHAMILSHGERGGNAESRLTEAEIGAQFLEIDKVMVMNFQDTQMQTQANEIVNAIEGVIREYEPDMIFTHSKHDLHQDHQTVYESTLRAARDRRTTILSYESPSVTDEFVPIYFIDVCGYVDVKIEAIRKHWDQHKKPYMNPDLIRSKMNFRGNQAKIDYAEGFEVVRMVSKI